MGGPAIVPRLPLAVLLAVLATGCVSARLTEGNAIDEAQVAHIEPGVTTRAEVLEWFGAPRSFTEPGALERLLRDGDLLPEDVLDLPFADVLVFEMTEARARGLFLLLWNRLDARVASDRLVVFFDDEDRVLHHGWRRGTDALR